MLDVLTHCTPEDYRFLAELLESPLNRTADSGLKALAARYERSEDPEIRAQLDDWIDRALRYLGSSDLAYALREATGQTPGVSLDEVISDAARMLRVPVPPPGSFRARAEALVESHATRTLEAMSPEEQQRMLEDLGVEKQQALRFVKTAAGVYAFPALVAAFQGFIIEGLLRRIVFGTITRLVGQRLSVALFGSLLAKMPWWLRVIGPISIAASVAWTTLDLQGPALRQTVPAVLYLGLVGHRARLHRVPVAEIAAE
jgi:uncharacterized protein YaaW (UPF0174 family)